MSDAGVSVISVRVNVRNPGQFFACCGLLELVDRISDGAEGWFDAEVFRITSALDGPKGLKVALDALARSVLSCDQSRGGRALRPVTFEKFQISLDWWIDVSGNKTSLKLWAGNQSAFGIATLLQHGVRDILEMSEELFDRAVPLTGRFGLDPRTAWNALDVGFSPNDQNMRVATYPAVELLAAIGLQGFRPREADGCFFYSAWSFPLGAAVARAASGGLLPDGETYRCETSRRGSYKGLTFANRIGGN